MKLPVRSLQRGDVLVATKRTIISTSEPYRGKRRMVLQRHNSTEVHPVEFRTDTQITIERQEPICQHEA